MTLQVTDANRVRTITLDRPEALNAFNEALYDATAEALLRRRRGSGGRGRAADRQRPRLQCRHRPARDARARHQPGLRARQARLHRACSTPWRSFRSRWCARSTGWGSASGRPSSASPTSPSCRPPPGSSARSPAWGWRRRRRSSYLFPRLMGHQDAAWMLLSAEWVSAEQALQMGLVWRVCEPDDLLPEARRHAELLAARPISSLIAVKRTMTAPLARADPGRARPGERGVRRADGRPREPRGAHGVRRGPGARLHRAPAWLVTPRPRWVYSHSRTHEMIHCLCTDMGTGMTDREATPATRPTRPRVGTQGSGGCWSTARATTRCR